MFYQIIGVLGIALGIGMFLIDSYIFALLLVGAGALLLRHQRYSSRSNLWENTHTSEVENEQESDDAGKDQKNDGKDRNDRQN